MAALNSESLSESPHEWDQLWIDARVASMCASKGVPYGAIEDGALAVRAGRIVWVGERGALPAGAPADGRVHSAGGRWITPGLIDCHTHLVHAGDRAREFEMRLQGASYEDIARQGGGILSTVRATRAADEGALVNSARIRLNALMNEGVTTVEIKSGYGLDRDTELRMLKAARSLGDIEPVTVVTTFLGAHALPPEYEGRANEYIEFVCQEVMPAAADAGLVDAVDAFCESIGFSRVQTERVFRAARNLGLPIKLHAEQLSDSGGAALAAGYGALSADHLEYVSDDAVAAMRENGTAAVLLPGAFYFLRENRVPPVDLFRRHGVPMAIASDNNPGSSPSCSLLLMLNMACTLFRMTPEEALAGVTRNAALALGMHSNIGTLEVGKRADFVLWNVDHPAELAYRIGFNPCHAVIRGGKPLAE
jgi:imidazolonepropionase